VIVVGGTGLYMRAALGELDLRPAPAPELRARWMRELDERGPQAMHAILAESAPALAARIAPTDGHRIVRALELREMGALQAGATNRSCGAGKRAIRRV